METIEVIRPLNTGKLVLHNLCKPMESRISRHDLEQKRKFAKSRGDVIGLWATIHAECEPARLALRAHEATLESM